MRDMQLELPGSYWAAHSRCSHPRLGCCFPSVRASSVHPRHLLRKPSACTLLSLLFTHPLQEPEPSLLRDCAGRCHPEAESLCSGGEAV